MSTVLLARSYYFTPGIAGVVFGTTNTKAAVAQSNYRPQIEFEQLAFDLSDIPPQWLEDSKNAASPSQPKQEVSNERRSKHPW